MMERTAVLDEVIEDLRRVLEKCDRADAATIAAIHVDLAMHLAIRERELGRAQAA